MQKEKVSEKISVKIIRKKYSDSSPFVKFVVNAALLGGAWVLFFTIFRNFEAVAFVYREGTRLLTTFLLYATQFTLSIIGYNSEVFSEAKIVQLEGTGGVLLDLGCLGRNLMGLYIGFLLAFPGSIKSKLWYIPMGVVIINFLNVLRIAGLSLVLLYIPEYMDINHHFVFSTLVYTCIFIMWVIWIRKYSSTKDLKKSKS